VPDETLLRIRRGRLDLAGGLHATEHAAIGVLPLFALCDRNDIGGVSTPLHPDTGAPEVFIHDGHPGGVGIAERGYQIIEELWGATLRAVAECPCQDGCPGCIQSPKCGNNNHPLDKAVAVLVLKSLLDVAQ
jgi:DEAD/DEAH box helicase domain-containing protein